MHVAIVVLLLGSIGCRSTLPMSDPSLCGSPVRIGGYLIDLPRGSMHVVGSGEDGLVGDLLLSERGLVVSYLAGGLPASWKNLKKSIEFH